MKKQFKEQIDYGNRPERMDPKLVKKLGDPEGLYAKNPAMRKKEKDVERLVSQRFQKVAEKLSRVTGIENLSSGQVKQMLTSDMMSKTMSVMRIEARHREELIELAKEVCLEEVGLTENMIKIEAHLGEQIDTSDFQYEPKNDDEDDDEDEENDEENGDEEKQNIDIPSFDIEDLTPEEELELEKHKRNIINAIVQGAAKKGHYIFQKPEVKERLDEIDSSLYQNYLVIMSVNDYLYFTMEDMIQMMSQSGSGIGGKVSVQPNDEDNEEDSSDSSDDEFIFSLKKEKDILFENDSSDLTINECDCDCEMCQQGYHHPDHELEFHTHDSNDDAVYEKRKAWGITRVYKMVDTCSAEFEAKTPYFYSSFEN